jgi:hypothetical protein
MSDPSSVLILDKMKSKENDSSSILGMIFFTIMLSITNYLSRQFTYFMDDVDLKKILNFELILHNFYKKNSVQFEGKISNTTSIYTGDLVQTCIFSDRFKALWEHIIKNTNDSIHSLKEYNIDKSDDAVYMVNQKDKFLISSENEIYAYTHSFDDKPLDSKDSKPSQKLLTVVLELYSFKSSVETIKNVVEKITHAYLSNLEKSRKLKRFIYTLTKANYEEFAYERWDETVFESTRTFDNLFFEKKRETLAKINFFVNNRKWYFDKGIPYSLGIGLHGPPGTGKTSFIKALSNLTDRHIVTISLKLIKTKKQLDSIFFEQRYNQSNEKNSIGFDKKIIVFEDIDCIGDIVLAREFHKPPPSPVETKENELKASSLIKLDIVDEPITLDDLLNLWDGIRETPGRIMVLSSNHFDKLDPAIRRPGRIDISLELSYASRRIIAEIYNHLFDDCLDEEVLKNIADEFYSPAEIVNIYMSEERSSTKFLSRLMQNQHVS